MIGDQVDRATCTVTIDNSPSASSRRVTALIQHAPNAVDAEDSFGHNRSPISAQIRAQEVTTKSLPECAPSPPGAATTPGGGGDIVAARWPPPPAGQSHHVGE